MADPRISGLVSLLLFGAAIPIWIFVCVVLPQSPGFGGFGVSRFLIPPIALTGIAFAVYRLLRDKPNSVAIAVLLLPIIAYSGLLAVSYLA